VKLVEVGYKSRERRGVKEYGQEEVKRGRVRKRRKLGRD
jgi:hypothetical protein